MITLITQETNDKLSQENESLRDELEEGLINKNISNARINTLLSQRQSFQNRYQNSFSQVSQLENQISQLNFQLNKLSSRPTLLKYRGLKDNYQQTIANLQIKQNQLNQTREQLRQVQTSNQNQQITIDSLNGQLTNKETLITRLRNELRTTQNNLNKAGKTGKY